MFKPVSQRRFNFVYLLMALLGLFVSAPVIQSFANESARLLVLIVLSMTLLLSVLSFIDSRETFSTGLVFSLIAMVISIVAVVTDELILDYLVLGTSLTFWLVAGWITGREVFGRGVVDINRITGSVCLYLIAGFTWAYLYIFLNLVTPGAFSGMTATLLSDKLPELVYFSFVTISTLGYGEITPVSPLARALVNVEAIFGQFYIAILVAALVGKYLSEEINRQDDKKK